MHGQQHMKLGLCCIGNMQDGTEHVLNTIRFTNVVFYFLGSSSLWFSHISTIQVKNESAARGYGGTAVCCKG